MLSWINNGCEEKDVFNVDKHWHFKAKNVLVKMSKAQVTVLVCSYMAGSETPDLATIET